MSFREGGVPETVSEPTPGYSPHLQPEIDAFLARTAQELHDAPPEVGCWSPPVRGLADLVRRDPIVQMYVLDAIDQVPTARRVVDDISGMLDALELLSGRPPEFQQDPERANFFPASTLFVPMMATPAGQTLFRNHAFNDGIRAVLRRWCDLLDSPESRTVLHTGDNGWLSQGSSVRHTLDDYVIPDKADPHWGFTSFNDFFHRQIRPDRRPIAHPLDPRVLVSPNDGTLYRVAHSVKTTDRFWVKSQPYSIYHMLAGDEQAHAFQGGTIFQSFLDGRDYHRFWSPVTGTVTKVTTVEGLMFSAVDSLSEDDTAGTYSQGYMACVNTRTLIFLQGDDPMIGTVCVVAVGISEVSSISTSITEGVHVSKGDELGYFSYGGSSICLLVARDVIREFTIDVARNGTALGTRGVQLRAGQGVAIC